MEFNILPDTPCVKIRHSNVQRQEVLIDPVRAVALVARQRDRPCNRLAFDIKQLLIGADQQGVEHGGLVDLPRRDVEVQRMTMSIAEDVDFAG